MKDMKKMSFESIFNWLYAAIFGRETVETWSSDDRAINHWVSRRPLVDLSSRTILISLLLLVLGGWNTQAWAGRVTGITAVERGKGSVYVRVERQRIYGWENASTGSTVDQDSSDPSKAEYSSGFYAKQAVFTVSSTGPGYTFEGWYEEDGTYLSNSTSYTGPYVTSGADRTYKYFARFAPIQYNIAFNANYGAGGTGTGTTATVANVKYDRDTTLTLNGYSKIAYIVTYNANGGSGLAKSSDSSYYSFYKWTQYSNGTGKQYDNGATVSNLSATDKATVTLYAKWGTTASKIILPVAPSVAPLNKTFAGWFVDGDAEETVVGIAGDEYTPTGNVTLKAKWTSVKIPGFTGSNQTLTVGETYNFGFSNTSTATPSSSSSENFYYVISDEVVNTDNTTGSPDGTKVISFNGNTVTALNKGTAKIKFYQEADAGNNIVAGESAEFTITVNKKEPTITWASAPYNYNSTINNFYSSDNKDTEIAAISRNTEVASISGATLTTYNKAGSARIVVSQAENYKWAAKKDSISVTPEKKNKHVEFTINADNNGNIEVTKTANVVWQSTGYYKLGTGDWGTDKPDDNVVIGFEGIPDKLSFTLSCDPVEFFGTHYPGKNDYTFEVFESATNGNWNSIWTNDNSKEYSKSENVEIPLSASTRFIKLRYSGTCWGRFTNIAVSELQYFRRQGENTTLDFASNQLNHAPAVQTFDVEHANAGYQTIVTAPAHYQVSLDGTNFASSVTYSDNSTAKTGGDKMGTFKVYVKYMADAEGTHNSNVVVSNNLCANISVSVKGITRGKLETHIEYIGETSYNVDIANTAATSLFRVIDENGAIVANPVITLSSNNSSVIAIEGNTAIDPLCGGSSTITATYTGDGTYSGSTKEQSITINRLEDEVSFDNAYASMVVGEELDITNWTSALSGADITITSIYQDILKVKNGKVIALKKGSGRLRADSEGNCIYNPGRSFLDITVRNPEDPCGSSLLYYSNTVKCGAYSHAASSPKELTLYDGPKDKLTFKAWKYSWATTQEEYLVLQDKNGNELHKFTYSVGDLPSDEPESANFEIDLENYQNVAKIVMYGEGSLNKYFSQIRVTQKAYLTASTSAVTMSTVKACGTATGQFTVSYSDLSRIHLTQTNNDFTYEVWDGDTKLDDFHNDCKAYGTYTIKFFYIPQTVGNYSNTVTLTASGKTQTITLSGTANKPERKIEWNIPLGNEIIATQSLLLDAYAKTDCLNPAGSVYYTASPADAVEINGANITFKRAATVTVTAHTAASDLYEDAADVSKVWTVSKVGVEMQILPTITSEITYGDNSNVIAYNEDWRAVDKLNGNTVSGAINYVSPASFTAAGVTNLTFNFTPSDLSVYDAMAFTVPVTVNPALPVATPSAANIVYGQKVSASLLSNEGTEGKWTWTDEKAEDVLAAGTYDGLAVHFKPSSGNYTELDGTVSLTVLKADAEATPAITAITYGQKVSDAVLTNTGATDGAWALVGVNANEVKDAGSYELNVHFTPTSSNYKEKDATVTLTVNKAASVATPSAAAIVEGQKVSESLLTNDGTDGTWTWDATVANTTPVAGLYNYTVHFTPENANYTTLTTTVQLQVNVPVYNFTNGKGDGNWEDPENWESGIVPTSNPDIIVTGALEINDSITVGSLTIQETGSVSVITNGTLTVNGVSNHLDSYGDIHVLNDGNLVLGNEAELKVNDFILDAQLRGYDNNNQNHEAHSGQVKGTEQLQIEGDAYFKITFDPRGAIDYGWYEFVVPFEVEVLNGIYQDGNLTTPLRNGVDFLVAQFDEAKRAKRTNAWTYYQGTMKPGVVYMITLDESKNWNTFLFKKKTSATLGAPATFNAVCTASAPTRDRGWNGLGNGTLQHRQLNLASNTKIQTYDHTRNTYIGHEADGFTYAVGTAFFVQVNEPTDIELYHVVSDVENSRPLLAPARSGAETGEFRLALTADGTDCAADRLWVSASEEATMEYTIGHDLIKMGTPTQAKMAQMWVPAGELNLCDVEMPMLNNNASTPVSIYAPKEGLYTLSVDRAPEDALLFLTKDGRVIWNLSMTPYLMELPKGTTENYGLRLVRTHTEVATGVDEIEAAGVHGRKVIIDNMIYIITSDGAMYDMTGKKVF